MRRYKLILAAAMTAMMVTACGSGDGIVINGTTAAAAGNTEVQVEKDAEAQQSTEDIVAEESRSGTKIEIVTGETTAAPEESLEGQTEAETTEAAAPAETTAASTTAAPTRAPETTAAKQYAVRDVQKTMYATSSVRIRSSYSTSAEVLGALAQGEKIEVTGESENGWMRVNYKGHVAYVSKSYLTETAPASNTGTSTAGSTSQSSGQTSKPTSTTNTATTPGGSTTSGTTSPGGSTTGGATSPGGSTTSGAASPGGSTTSGATSPGSSTTTGATSPGGSTTSGAASPGGSTTSGATSPGSSTTTPGATSPGGSSSGTASGTQGSVTGNITALDPSGMTLQASNGASYHFVWGGSVPALAPGEKVQVQYVTDSSGTNTVTQISK